MSSSLISVPLSPYSNSIVILHVQVARFQHNVPRTRIVATARQDARLTEVARLTQWAIVARADQANKRGVGDPPAPKPDPHPPKKPARQHPSPRPLPKQPGKRPTPRPRSKNPTPNAKKAREFGMRKSRLRRTQVLQQYCDVATGKIFEQ